MAKNFTLLALPLMLAATMAGAAENESAIVSFSIFGGLTNGGDYFATDIIDTYTNATIEYHNANNPDDQRPLQPAAVKPVGEQYNHQGLRAGGFAVIGAGVNVKLHNRVDVQVNLGYHWDRKQDPSLKLSRFEIEAIPYFQLSDNIRIGLGVTHHFNNHFGSNATYSEHSEQQLKLGLFPNGSADQAPKNNHEVISAALFNQLANYQQLLTPEQTPYDADDLAMSINHELGNSTGWIGSVTYDLPQLNSRFELRLVSISYHFDTTMALFERSDSNRSSLISSNKRQTVDGNHVGIYYHWLF